MSRILLTRTNLTLITVVALALGSVACKSKDEAPAPETAPVEASAPAASAPAAEAKTDEWAWADSTKPAGGSAPVSPADTTRDITESRPITPPPAPSAPRQPKPKPAPKDPTNAFETPKDDVPYGDDKVAAPAPKVAYTAPAGAAFDAKLDQTLSSDTAEVGQAVTATLDADITDGAGHVVLPAGTRLVGTVTQVVSAKKVKKKSELAYAFTKAELPDGTSVAVSAGQKLEGKGYTKKDGAIIGGSAAGGAILGGILGGDAKSTAAGAVLGGAIGSGVSMSKKGEDVEIPQGTLVGYTLGTPVTIER